MRIVSREAQACEQVRLRASQLRDRTAVHVRPPREWPRAGHEPSAKTAWWDRRAAGCPQEKRDVFEGDRRAVAFSAGGDGGRKSPERAGRDAVTRARRGWRRPSRGRAGAVGIAIKQALVD